MFGSRRGASGAATLLMLVAFLGIGGFMYWLSVTAKSSAQVVVEEDAPAEMTGDATMLSLADFSANPSGFEGQTIRINEVEVVSLLGTHAFWMNLTTKTPYLVRVDPALYDAGLMLTSGGAADVMGTVRVMSDSVLDAWAADGSFTSDVNRIEAEFAESYIDAIQVQARAGAGA